MSMLHHTNQQVFAIIRFDIFQADDATPDELVTVKSIVWDQTTAEQEVARLNTLNADKECIYFWQMTRLQEPHTLDEQRHELQTVAALNSD